MSESLVKKAHGLYKDGQFEQATSLYRRLNAMFGKGLFDINIKLCDDKRLIASAETNHQMILPIETSSSLTSNSAEDQLAETQRLLEHYFNLCQSLEMRSAGV